MNDLRSIIARHSGPPTNVEAVIRELGLELDKKADLDSEISGQIERLPNGGYRISANRDQPYFRQRFTMAHELGHFLYHSHLIGDGVDDNKAFRSEASGRFWNRNVGPSEETQANKFAASLLMPASLVKKAWEETRDPAELAKVFQVSAAAMRIRLESLGLA